MLSRRGFLGRLVGAVAAVVAAPALLEASDPIVPITIADEVNIAWVWGPETFYVGDVITIAGRESLNPVTGKPTGHLQRFVVTQSSTADQIAAWPDIRLNPTLIGPGSRYANVSSAAPFRPEDVQAWTPVYERVRVPQRFTVSKGQAFQPQAVGDWYDHRRVLAR